MRKARINTNYTQITTNILICLSGCVLSAFIFCRSVFADTLYLKRGTQLEGRVVRQDEKKVIFRVGGEEDGVDVTFFSDEILRIDKTEVSNFLTFPLGKDKQINIPRPALTKEPLLTEKAKQQLEQRPQPKEEEQFKPQEVQPETQPIGKENQLEEDTMFEGVYKRTNGLLSKKKTIVDELMPLLDKEEQDYFTRLDLIGKQYMSATAPIMAQISTAASQGSVVTLTDAIKDIPSQIDKVIEQVKNSKVPSAFFDFHKKYLDGLISTKEIFVYIAKGDSANYQSKIADMQNVQNDLNQELEKILESKKKNALQKSISEK